MSRKAPTQPNKVKCLSCGQELESKYVHDFQMCNCPNQTFTDGGNEYHRRGGMDLSKIAIWHDGEYVSAVDEFKEAANDYNGNQ